MGDLLPDLGKYAGTVLSSYAVSFVLIAALVVMSVLRSRKIKRDLAEIEARRARKT
jgi:heme exporter protein D